METEPFKQKDCVGDMAPEAIPPNEMLEIFGRLNVAGQQLIYTQDSIKTAHPAAPMVRYSKRKYPANFLGD
jgi:hypothetical protein